MRLHPCLTLLAAVTYSLTVPVHAGEIPGGQGWEASCSVGFARFNELATARVRCLPGADVIGMALTMALGRTGVAALSGESGLPLLSRTAMEFERIVVLPVGDWVHGAVATPVESVTSAVQAGKDVVSDASNEGAEAVAQVDGDLAVAAVMAEEVSAEDVVANLGAEGAEAVAVLKVDSVADVDVGYLVRLGAAGMRLDPSALPAGGRWVDSTVETTVGKRAVRDAWFGERAAAVRFADAMEREVGRTVSVLPGRVL